MTRSIARSLSHCLVLLALSPGMALAQSHSMSSGDSPFRTMTPAEWSRVTVHLPRCEGATQPSRDGALVLETWHVDSLEGTIALPHGFKLHPSRRGFQWIGPDSSSISINGTWALGGMAMSGAKHLHGMSMCAAELFGQKVPAEEFAMIMTSTGDTSYFSTPSVFVKTGQGLQVMLQARSPERRAQLLELAESMHLSVPGPPHD